jgi:hypothetical protein
MEIDPLLLLVAGCEIGFWVLLVAGLGARYLLRARRLSTGLLLAVPALDVVLVSASLLDVARGAPPGAVHGIAALYLGFTVAFGHATIAWLDARFAHRFAGGPAPARPGPADRVRREWRDWGRLLLAWAVALAVLGLTALIAGTGVPGPLAWSADPLWSWGARIAPVAAIWFAVGPLWATLAPRERSRA